MQDFRKLDVWRESMNLCKAVFLLIERTDNRELNSQLSRSAISVPSNIAEGCGRATAKALYNHLNIAYASACELQCQIILAGYIIGNNTEEEQAMSERVQKMLYSLMGKVNKQHITKY